MTPTKNPNTDEAGKRMVEQVENAQKNNGGAEATKNEHTKMEAQKPQKECLALNLGYCLLDLT
jgi:hypothetical protein